MGLILSWLQITLFIWKSVDLKFVTNCCYTSYEYKMHKDSNSSRGFTPESNPIFFRIWLIYLKSCTVEFETSCCYASYEHKIEEDILNVEIRFRRRTYFLLLLAQRTYFLLFDFIYAESDRAEIYCKLLQHIIRQQIWWGLYFWQQHKWCKKMTLFIWKAKI